MSEEPQATSESAGEGVAETAPASHEVVTHTPLQPI